MTNKIKNVTFSLPTELMEKYKDYAKSSLITSVNAGVREALEEYAVKIEREKLKAEMILAAQDPLFMKDLAECMQAFTPSDMETTGRLKE
jgi:metal-responsive CopG/Arc/MetJ family transcriptional regulator